MTDQIRGPSRAATAEIVARFANAGRDDPTIAVRLGITAAQVRSLRRDFGIRPGASAAARARQEGTTIMTLAEIKRRVKPGQIYQVTSHQADPHLNSPVVVRVKRTASYAFVVEHALGESKITWPPARHVKRDEDGTLHLFGWDVRAGLPLWTLVPLGAGEPEVDRG